MKILKELIEDKIFCRKLFKLTLPITLQSLMLALVAAGDAFMLGMIDQDSMAAVSLATQIQFIQNMALWAIVSAVGILGAQYWGKRDLRKMDEIFGISIRQSVIISVQFFVACEYYPYYLMKLFANDANLIAIGVRYLRIAAWSYLLTGISQCYLAMMKVSEHAECSAWISSGAVILNIIFNAVFIFGLFGCPAMGVEGAAYATILARVIEFLACVMISFRRSFIQLKIRMLFHWNKTLLLDFEKCALPILSAGMLWGTGFTAYTAIMGQLGPDPAAANSIAAVARDLMCCLCNGISAAGGILIGNELGAGNLELGKKYGQRLVVFAFGTGFISTIVILCCIPAVIHLVKLTPEARNLMIGMFVILSFYMIGRCVCTVMINGVFASGGDTLFDMYSLVVFMWCFALPCAFLGAFYWHLPVLLVYACTCLDEVGKVPWVMYHFTRYKWVVNLTRS